MWVLLTGGTMGMRRDEATGSLRPERGHLARMLQSRGWHRAPAPVPASRPRARVQQVDVDVDEFETPLDSSDMGPEEWQRVASAVAAKYDDYDGFVVVMGTDTMAYCSTAVSFMLGETLGKTVCFTGSMLPLEHELTDGQRNLSLAIEVAALNLFPEVVVVFHDVVLRACRSKKVAAESLDAFASPNFPPLAVAGTELVVQHALVRARPASVPMLTFRPEMDPNVLALKLVPGFALPALVSLFAQTDVKAVVLELSLIHI